MNKKEAIIEQLCLLGLGSDESKIYLELLRKPSTHGQLTLATGINRTKIYRLVDLMQKRGVILRRTDDQGKFLVAAQPSVLKRLLLFDEEQLKNRQEILTQLLPGLNDILEGGSTDFIVNTYEGLEGFKQMLWHELSAEKACYCIGYGTLEDLGISKRWAEKHRQLTVEANYSILELSNPGHTPQYFSENVTFVTKNYQRKFISRSLLAINQLTVIYNNTVSTYGIQGDKKVGVEIICKTYAQTMQQVFQHYWDLAEAEERVDAHVGRS